MSIAVEDPKQVARLNPFVAQALAFTEAYKTCASSHKAIREAMCLKTQYPALMGEIRPGDLFAGRKAQQRMAYLGTIWWAGFPAGYEGKQGGYCFDFNLARTAGKTTQEKQILADLVQFWERECTATKALATWDDELRTYLKGSGQIAGSANGFCVAVDLDRLLQKGIPGLMKDIQAKRDEFQKKGEDTGFYDGLRIAMEAVVDVCRHYQQQATLLARTSESAQQRQQLSEMAKTLDAAATRAPRTLREAMQLLWIYTHLVSGNHPEAWRIDTALGDFLARDIDSGLITEEQAVEMTQSLWCMFSENGADALCRIVIGGMGRRNPANADRFAMVAMEATRRHRRVTPQLTLRFYKGQDAKLSKKAFDCIAEGCVYPMLYNDDVIVPGIARALDVSMEDAQLYHPLGCGEYMLAHCSPSLLCNVWSIPKSVDAVLHNGMSDGQLIGLKTGTLESLDTFEKFYEAVVKQFHFAAGLSAKMYRRVCDSVPQECSFLLASMLTDDCVERGAGLLEGVRYLGACCMGHGFTNAADSLVAIRKLVYREKRITLQQLVQAIDADFVGFEEIHRMLQGAPKFGNDDQEADSMLVEMWREINHAAKLAGKREKLAFFTISSVNPGGYGMGAGCGATADGRKKGQPFAIGHAPTAGQDRCGLTALFNSIAKVDADNGGATTNVKISREFFTSSRKKVESLFDVYFAGGGMQASVTVINRDDLQAAMKEPQKYSHVLVRVGGWCARFIDLEKSVQEEIIRRTLY